MTTDPETMTFTELTDHLPRPCDSVVSFVVELLVTSDGEPWAYVSRGHHTSEEFAAAVLNQLGDEIDPEGLRHTYGRWVPKTDPDAVYGCRFIECRPGRGAFPCTIIDVD